MNSLNGRICIVTGAAQGIGKGIAQRLAAEGATVVVADLNGEAASATAAELGNDSIGVTVDISDRTAVDAMVAEAKDKYGRIDVLVNNAGIGIAVPALKETPEQFRSVVDVNLHGAYWAAKECAAVMEPGGCIVNVASVLGLTAGFAPQAAYSATKAAVLGLTRDLAAQWGSRRGIRVNALAPGYFASEMTDEIPEKMLADITGSTIFGRLGLQPELDSALLFLASDASSFITGTTLVVDGGMTMH